MADIKGDLEIGKDLRVANKASINSNDTSKTLVVGGTAKFIDVLVSSTQGAYSLPLSAGVSGQLLISTGNGGRFNWRDRDETLYLTETSADQKYIPFIGNITNQTLNLSFNNNVNNLIEIIENTSLRIQTPEHNLISLSYTGVVPEISIGDLTENMSVEINSIRKLRNIVADSSLVFYEHDFVSTFSFPTSQPATSGKALISTKSNGETEWRSIFTEASAQLLINNIAVSALSQLTNNVGFVSAAQFVGLGIIDVRVSGTSNGRQIIVSAADRTPTFTTTNLGVGAAVGIAVSANRDFIFRTITGAGSIQVSAGATEIVVSAPIYNQVSALSQLANDQGFVSAAQFVGGGIIEVSAAGGIIRISAATTQVAVQASALGGGSSVVIGTSANETRYRTFVGSGSIQISAGATEIVVSAPIYNQVSALSQLTNDVGYITQITESVLGGGEAVIVNISGVNNIIHRSIVATGAIQLSASPTEIVLSAAPNPTLLSELTNDQGFVSAVQFVGAGIIQVRVSGTGADQQIILSAATTQVAVQASALGGGSSVVIGTSANETRYRTFIGAGSIQISAGATTITVSAPIYNQVSALSQLTNNVGFVSAAQFAGLGIINVRVSGTSNGKQIIVSAADRTPTFTTTNLGGAQQVAVSVSANKGFNFRTINGNGIIQVRTSGNVIEVSAADRIPTFTTTNLGGGQPIISKISAQEITQKTLVGVGNLTVSATATEISFSYTPPVLDRLNFTAANFENPNNANWSISALAPATVDSLNNSLTIRAFDDTTEEGVGFYLRPPSDATTITFNFVLRPQTAPGSTQNVLFRLHRRIIGVNSAVSTWSITNLTAISIPNNTNYQYRSQTTTLTSLGITPGLVHLIELSRQGTNGGDTLAGDLNLLNLEVVLS